MFQFRFLWESEHCLVAGRSFIAAAGLLFGVMAAAGAAPVWAQAVPAPAAAAPQAESPAKPQIKPAPPTPIAIKKVELGDGDPWNPAWDKLIEESLPADLLSNQRARAVRPLCPRFKTMTLANKRAFWAYFFQALAGAEAGLKPTADVKHNDAEVAVIDRVTHHTVRQEGLLQLTYMDSLRYGCDFDWEKDKDLPVHDPAKTILQPENNLLCGIKILENQLVTRRKPLLTESSYWVTLRPRHMSFQIFLKQMTNVPAACGSKLRRPSPEERASPAASEAAEGRQAERPAPAPSGASGAAAPATSSDPTAH